jgi:hydroxymethylbilane synthase
MIIIGTRGSDLALWQANFTKDLLEKQGHEVEIKIIETKGDTSQQWNTSFDKLEGKGFFTKELEEALLNKTIDVAVHSHKDLPTENPDGLIIAGVSSRENPADWLIMRDEAEDTTKKFNLKQGAKVELLLREENHNYYHSDQMLRLLIYEVMFQLVLIN